MQELLKEFEKHGLTEEQSLNSIQAINSWLEEHYPVAGAMVSAWVRSESAEMKA